MFDIMNQQIQSLMQRMLSKMLEDQQRIAKIRSLTGGGQSQSAQSTQSTLKTEQNNVLQKIKQADKGVSAGAEMSSFGDIIQKAALQHQIDPNLIKAVVQSESNFQSDAVSPAGALGLMQLMPDTARDLGVSDPLNPQQNVEGGTSYLSNLLDYYNGNVKLALAAYNAGPGTVDSYGGIPPYAETQTYVQRVLGKLSDYQSEDTSSDY